MSKIIQLFFFTLTLSFFAGAQQHSYCQNLLHTDGTQKNICQKNGKEYLLLEFYSSGCPHCRNNVGNFKNLENATANVAYSRLVSLNSLDNAKSFAERYDIDTPIAIDTQRSAARAIGVRGIPALFILNKNNDIIYKHAGKLNQQVINQIKELLH